MKEYLSKSNHTKIKIYVSGTPDIQQIPKELADAYIAGLERRITEVAMKKKQTQTIES